LRTNVDTPASPAEPASSAGRTPKWTWAAAAVALVVAIAVAVFVISHDDDNNGSRALDSQRIAATQSACQQWLDDSADATGTPSGWCNDMTNWMHDQIGNGRMTGSMMWGSPEGMLDTCRRWMSTAPSEGATTTRASCDQMATWMSQHMGNWEDEEGWDDHMDDGHWMMNE
jgi:hypothetical protein